jgi:hypothetical protein
MVAKVRDLLSLPQSRRLCGAKKKWFAFSKLNIDSKDIISRLAAQPQPQMTDLSLFQTKIYELRGVKVMLDFDLALLYEVETRSLKQSVRRNEYRFPDDFMFQLTKPEWQELITNCDKLPESIKFSPQTPFAFREQGVAMLSTVLKSKKAVETNIAIMRAFVEVRKAISLQSNLSEQIMALKNNLEQRLGEHDVQLMEIYAVMEQFIDEKTEQKNWENRKKLGYK